MSVLKIVATIGFLVSLALSTPAFAKGEQVDLAKMTCAEAAEEGAEFVTVLIFWIDGYLSKEMNDTVMTPEWLKELGAAVTTSCEQNPSKPLLDLVREQVK